MTKVDTLVKSGFIKVRPIERKWEYSGFVYWSEKFCVY